MVRLSHGGLCYPLAGVTLTADLLARRYVRGAESERKTVLLQAMCDENFTCLFDAAFHELHEHPDFTRAKK